MINCKLYRKLLSLSILSLIAPWQLLQQIHVSGLLAWKTRLWSDYNVLLTKLKNINMAFRVDVNKGPLTLTHDRKYHDVLWYFCAHFIFIKIYILNMRNRYPNVLCVKTILLILNFLFWEFFFKLWIAINYFKKFGKDL